MEPLRNKIAIPFFILSLLLLLVGLLFGLLGSLQYLYPSLLKNSLSFAKIRPLHVSSVVFWILSAAIGGVIVFFQEHTGKSLKYPLLVRWQFWLFALSTIAILISYIFGVFGGREYWEFHPLFTIPIMLSWILFIINLFSSIGKFKEQPVYVWMWLIGSVFFLFTYIESNLWWLPWFRNEIIQDMTIQWKSYGSLVGSWNMLIYGSSIYLMDKIAGNQKYSHSSLAFMLFFLGLLNGMFNWGHHIYTLPTHSIIKHIAYIVSMTELILLARIIYLWRSSLNTAKKHFHILSYKFILAADIWVLITLALAILMSVPALNIYMHGTHVVVSHTMGATIGINTFLLLSFIFDKTNKVEKETQWIRFGYIIIQICLPIFFLSLLVAGFMKGFWQMQEIQQIFSVMMVSLRPLFIVFSIAGFGLVIGFSMIIFAALKRLIFLQKIIENR